MLVVHYTRTALVPTDNALGCNFRRFSRWVSGLIPSPSPSKWPSAIINATLVELLETSPSL